MRVRDAIGIPARIQGLSFRHHHTQSGKHAPGLLKVVPTPIPNGRTRRSQVYRGSAVPASRASGMRFGLTLRKALRNRLSWSGVWKGIAEFSVVACRSQWSHRNRTSPDISPVCGIDSGHPGPRPSGARCARVHLRSCCDVANLGQNIRPEAAKRTVTQTATLDTGDILMTINKLHASESALVHILAGARMYARRPKGVGQDGPRKISGLGWVPRVLVAKDGNELFGQSPVVAVPDHGG